MTDRELMQQALEALDCLQPSAWELSDRMGADTDKTITALRERLAQPDNGGKTGWPPGLMQDDDKRLSKWLASKPDARAKVREALEQPEQEPVAWMHPSWVNPETRGWASDSFESSPIDGWTPLYTTPPRREWVGMTDEEVADELEDCTHDGGFVHWNTFARAIEAKLREKNA